MAWTPAEMEGFQKTIAPSLMPALSGRDLLVDTSFAVRGFIVAGDHKKRSYMYPSYRWAGTLQARPATRVNLNQRADKRIGIFATARAACYRH